MTSFFSYTDTHVGIFMGLSMAMMIYLVRKSFKFLMRNNVLDLIATMLLKTNYVNNMYQKKIKKSPFNLIKPKYYFNKMPDYGLDITTCFDIVKSYSKAPKEKLKSEMNSGLLYCRLNDNDSSVSDSVPKTLGGLRMYVYDQTYYWNNLHDEEFKESYSIQQQLGLMIADLVGYTKDDFCSLHTTGGTQSIMTAARAYVKYGMEVKRLKRKNVTIITLDTFHASIDKAKESNGFNLIKLETDNGRIEIKQILDTVLKNKNNVVAIFISCPAYPHGLIDKFSSISKICVEYGIGLHIDCCLGGFINNGSYILDTKGLTSLSIDPHKNGQCPKGISLLYCKKLLNDNFLAYYSIYAFPDWKGGLYGTLKDDGSSSFVEVFESYMTLLYYGKNYYIRCAHEIKDACREITKRIAPYCDMINTEPLNVVSFKIRRNNNKISYEFANRMKKEGINLTIIADGVLQICVTAAITEDKHNVDRFVEKFIKSMDNIDNIDTANETVRLYSSIDIAINPDSKNIIDYILNKLFGKMAIRDTIREYFIAHLTPSYIEHSLPSVENQKKI